MRTLALFIAIGLIGTIPRAAKAWDHDEHERKWKQDHGDDRRDYDDREHHRRYGDACFRDEHLRVIRDYYHPRGLPPGLEKKLYATGQLPPGWERKVHPFPVELERRLPPLCGGCARGYMNGYAIVYQPRTHIIVDFHAVLAP
jgi:hypothetical protein